MKKLKLSGKMVTVPLKQDHAAEDEPEKVVTRRGGYTMPNKLRGIGEAIDWLDQYQDEDPWSESAKQARQLVRGLENALDYCVGKGLVKFETDAGAPEIDGKEIGDNE